jgi:hypothetical protein
MAGVHLLWAGASLASQDGAVAAIVLSLMSVAYAYRTKNNTVFMENPRQFGVGREDCT